MMTSASRLIVPLLALSLLAGGCIAFGPRVVRVPDAPTANHEEGIAYLHIENGAAKVTRGSTTSDAFDETELLSGDRVLVVSGDVTLVYPDAGMSKLDPGTDIVILADGEDGTVFTEVQLTAGTIWTRFEKLFGPNEHFSVQANGVVATVRGTAFGVSMENGSIDVQVAEHEVEVTSEALQSAKDQKHSKVSLKAGKALRLTAREMSDQKDTGMMKKIRSLTPAEEKKAGFAFMMKKLDKKQMERPQNPSRMKGASTIPTSFQPRMDFLKEYVKTEAQERGFILPTRGVLPGEVAPTQVDPSVNGPTSTQVQTTATFNFQ
jgi:hypothetical protein